MDRTGQIWVSYEYIFLIVDSQIEEWLPQEVQHIASKIKHAIIYLGFPGNHNGKSGTYYMVEYPQNPLEKYKETKRIL